MVFDLIAVADFSETGLWEFITRNWALISIATTLTLLVVVPLLIIRKYVGVALNLMDDFSPPRFSGGCENLDPADVGDLVHIDAFDGHRLAGSMLVADSTVTPRGLIIFAHEFGTNRSSHVRYSRPLRAAGYDVLAFDFRGHGESPSDPEYKARQFPSDHEVFDMLGAIAFAEDYLEQRSRPKQIGTFGLSRGGSATILAAARVDCVKAIAVDGAFSSESVAEYLIRRWARIFAKRRIAYETPPGAYWRLLTKWILAAAERKFKCRFPSVRRTLRRMEPTPVLFIHGERDTFIPLEQAHMLYNLARPPRYLWIVPGARHNQSICKQPDAYARHIVSFFDRHLGNCASDDRWDETALSDLAQPVADERLDVPDPFAASTTQIHKRLASVRSVPDS